MIRRSDRRKADGRDTTRIARMLAVAALMAAVLLHPHQLPAIELTEASVLRSIQQAQQFLKSQQNDNGAWTIVATTHHQVGISALSLMALLNSGMTVGDPTIDRGLQYLRSLEMSELTMTYEVSLVVMALVAARDGERDRGLLSALAQRLEDGQITRGANAGLWTYSLTGGIAEFGGDRSNGQFAVLGLRDAVEYGIPVERETWERVRNHWVSAQSADGGWTYSGLGGGGSTGSMTAAGIATMVIASEMLDIDNTLGPDGQPVCCPTVKDDDVLQRGIDWLSKHFAVGHNPSSKLWLLYYLYGLERAGRLGGVRFFGEHDWYREGAQFLIDRQSQRDGSWKGEGGLETEPVIGTSLSLLFLAKGLSPVLINKLEFDTSDDAADPTPYWNRHRHDARNMTKFISGLPKWPKLLTWQTIDIDRLKGQTGLRDLRMAPVLLLTSDRRPDFDEAQVELLRQYVDAGGFLFAVRNCGSSDFENGFRELIRRMYPAGEATLAKLPDDHPVFRSEYLLEPSSVELLGVDFGCRTAIMYSPDDLSCLWDKWARLDPPGRPVQLKTMITKANRVGVNVIAYATGREPPSKLGQDALLAEAGEDDPIERGLLQIAKLRHSGGWDAAPAALRNLLTALNQSVGVSASRKARDLPVTDPNLFKYPIAYMHGRYRFEFSKQELAQLREYLQRGGVLFADSCCGAKVFDSSFRAMIEQAFPGKSLKRIPPNHELFSTKVGFDLRQVRRRGPDFDNPNAALETSVTVGEPFLEGLEIDGRLAVIYSKYDISCALERQASVACSGYVSEDAVRIAMNVVLYSLLQDVTSLRVRQ